MIKFRTIFIMTIMALLTVVFVSCSGNDYSELEIDIHELSRSLATEDIYNDSMYSLDENIAHMLYGLDESVTMQAYGGSGATPEAVLVAAAESAEQAEELLKNITEYNNKQINIFSKYNTQYQPEAKSAVIESYGKYIVYCVSKDSEASREIIRLYTEK